MTFVVAFALSSFAEALLIGIIATIVFQAGALVLVAALMVWRRQFPLAALVTVVSWIAWVSAVGSLFSTIEWLLAVAALLFSFWLMDQRLSGDPLMVSLNTWGDFGLHIPLALSFSEAHNFPPEYPFFASEPIHYHFGYDFFAGTLERQGLPIAQTFNLPGALGFTAMILMVFELGRFLFRRVAVGLMAVVLLITNGSLAFLRYFELFDNDVPEALTNLWDHNRYLAIGPYLVDGKIDKISIFWTLNVFLTQTHLILVMAAVLFVAYGLIQPLRRGEPLWTQRALGLGALMGMSFWMNGVVFIASMVFFIGLFFAFGGWRRAVRWLPVLAAGFVMLMAAGSSLDSGFYRVALVYALGVLVVFGRPKESLSFLVPAALIAAPQVVWLNGGLTNDGSLQFHTGYLVDGFGFDRLISYWDFAEYWWLNLGLALPLMVFAVFWGSASDRKLMLAVMGIFIFGNFVQLSRDLGGHNHKVFNLWEILMNLFVAFAFVRLWEVWRQEVEVGTLSTRLAGLPRAGARYAALAALPVVFGVLVLSGVIDFMTIKNDARFSVFGDNQAAAEWIADNTPKDAVFLTTYGDIYTAPTLAGRRIFLGYEPWVGSAGYDYQPRIQTVAAIYGAPFKSEACRLLTEHEIDYVYLGPRERDGGRFVVNEAMFVGEFVAAASLDRVEIYDVARSCGSALVAGG
jgi:hypothetical protein